jgi:hypothetical protein
MIYPRTIFHVPSFGGSLVIAINQKTIKENCIFFEMFLL